MLDKTNPKHHQNCNTNSKEEDSNKVAKKERENLVPQPFSGLRDLDHHSCFNKDHNKTLAMYISSAFSSLTSLDNS